jgi:hypothetical protein
MLFLHCHRSPVSLFWSPTEKLAFQASGSDIPAFEAFASFAWLFGDLKARLAPYFCRNAFTAICCMCALLSSPSELRSLP